MTDMILMFIVFMLFGFSVVSLYYVVKIHHLIQLQSFSQANSIFAKQNDLKRLDIFGLMSKLSEPHLITQLSNVGRAVIEKSDALKATFSFDPSQGKKRLISVSFEIPEGNFSISLAQDNFLQDSTCLYKVVGPVREGGEAPDEEYITHENHFIDWINEQLLEFDWVKVKKIPKS